MYCPRCDKNGAVKFFEAPSSNAWELYRCPHCSFIWRSTEKSKITNKDQYNSDFKLNDERMKQMIDKPPIPPLKNA